MFAPLAACAPFIVVLAVAQDLPVLPLTEAVALARSQHPEVRRAEAAASQVLARRVGAAQILQQPTELSVDVGRRRDNSTSLPPSTGLEWTVRLGQMVEVAGQRGTRLREVAWASAAAQLHLDEARLQAAASSAMDFVRAQAAEASVHAATARAQLAQKVLRMVAAKELAGATGGLERTLAEVERGDARAQLQRALAARQASRAALWYSLGLHGVTDRPLPPLEPPPPPTTGQTLALLHVAIAASDAGTPAAYSVPAATPAAKPCDDASCEAAAAEVGAADASYDADPGGDEDRPSHVAEAAPIPPSMSAQAAARALDMAQVAVRNRPLGQALLATSEGLKASVDRLVREAVPSPTLAFEAQSQQPGQMYLGGGLSLPLPIVQRRQGARAEARAAIHTAELERELFAARCQWEASVAVRQLEAATSVWRAVHQEQLPAAQGHVDMTVAAWKAGKLDLSQVVQSLRYLTEARQRATDAVEVLWRARIDYNRVLGELP